MQQTSTAMQAISQIEEGAQPRYRELEFGVRSIWVRRRGMALFMCAPIRSWPLMRCA